MIKNSSQNYCRLLTLSRTKSFKFLLSSTLISQIQSQALFFNYFQFVAVNLSAFHLQYQLWSSISITFHFFFLLSYRNFVARSKKLFFSKKFTSLNHTRRFSRFRVTSKVRVLKITCLLVAWAVKTFFLTQHLKFHLPNEARKRKKKSFQRKILENENSRKSLFTETKWFAPKMKISRARLRKANILFLSSFFALSQVANDETSELNFLKSKTETDERARFEVERATDYMWRHQRNPVSVWSGILWNFCSLFFLLSWLKENARQWRLLSSFQGFRGEFLESIIEDF